MGLFLVAVVDILLLVWLTFMNLNFIYSLFKGAPSIYASPQAIRDCLRAVKLAPGETLLDLGCGDGRSLIIAAREFGAKGIGVEASLYCCLLSRWHVWRTGQRSKIQIKWQGIQQAETLAKRVDVVYLYLYPNLLAEIEPWLFKALPAGSRLVSLSFPFAQHRPTKTILTRTLRHQTKLYVYQR